MAAAASNSLTWRITVEIIASMAFRRETVDGTERLASRSRLIPCVIAYPELTVALRGPEEWPGGKRSAPMGWEKLPLVADVVCEANPMKAAERVEVYLDSFIDMLAFGLYSAIGVGEVAILDVTPPVSIGDKRSEVIFPSSPFGTSVRGMDTGSITGSLALGLPTALPVLDSRTAAILRWFHKSLATDLLHDKFMFMWIALEILCDLSDVSVEAPYHARCGHLISVCPECGESTSKEVRGQTIQQFLVSKLSVDAPAAKQLWAIRQLMHGAINFDSAKLRDLPRLVEELRRAVVAGIRGRLDVPEGVPPIISAEKGLFGFPSSGVQVIREITGHDILPLVPDRDTPPVTL